MNQRRATVLVAAMTAVSVFGIASAAPASAQETAPSKTRTTHAESNFGVTDPVVLDEIAQIRDSGGVILAVSQSPYVPDGDRAGSSSRALPSGCGLTVLVHRDNRVIEGSAVTSCNFPFTGGVMTSTMTHYNPDWKVWDSTVATGRRAGSGKTMAIYSTYNCKNGNASNYRFTATGKLVRGSTSYSSAAYDVFDKNVPCGT